MSARDPIKVYDARWEVHEFDDAAIVRLFEATYAYGRRLGVDTVTLARDGRLGAPHVLELATDTAVRMGLSTYVCTAPASTPHGYFLALHVSREHPNTMGLMVTASHNPRQYIGVKFTVPTVQAIGYGCGPMGGLSAVRQIYHSAERFGPAAGGSLHLVDLSREFIEFSMQQAGVGAGALAGMAVVVDGFHGSAGPELMTALQRAGACVEPLRLIPDGHFPTGSPNPTSRGKMDRAVAAAAEKDCVAAIGLDGDGDRVVFGDRRGVLSAGFAAVPILRTCVREHEASQPPKASRCVPGPVVFVRPPALYDPKVNLLALAEWSSIGVRPVLFRNGHSQIKDYMRRVGAVAGVEESGHYYHRLRLGDLVVWCENSILTVLQFLRALREGPELMDELWAMQGRVRTTGELNYQFPDDATRDQALGALIHHFLADGARTVTATPEGIDLHGTVVSRGVIIDDAGVRLEPAWYTGYLRVATNEKGVVRSYFSSADPNRIEQIESVVRGILANELGGNLID
ncbi:MAG: hypothetical protein HY718_07730 [Planctomycetes bacterium]|nr:hypothetical protein [Planctomycetota bacterium]